MRREIIAVIAPLIGALIVVSSASILTAADFVDVPTLLIAAVLAVGFPFGLGLSLALSAWLHPSLRAKGQLGFLVCILVPVLVAVPIGLLLGHRGVLLSLVAWAALSGAIYRALCRDQEGLKNDV
jgi:apolipoprotein N-acyltransferase